MGHGMQRKRSILFSRSTWQYRHEGIPNEYYFLRKRPLKLIHYGCSIELEYYSTSSCSILRLHMCTTSATGALHVRTIPSKGIQMQSQLFTIDTCLTLFTIVCGCFASLGEEMWSQVFIEND